MPRTDNSGDLFPVLLQFAGTDMQLCWVWYDPQKKPYYGHYTNYGEPDFAKRVIEFYSHNSACLWASFQEKLRLGFQKLFHDFVVVKI